MSARAPRDLPVPGTGTWQIDLSDGTHAYSPGFLGLLGFGPDEVKPDGDFWHRQVHPDDLVALDRELDANLAARRLAVEYRLRRKDGGWAWVAARGQVERDPSGVPLRITGIAVDVSARLGELETARARAEAGAAAKSAFLATMSHEIRTPLNGALANLELLAATPLSPEQRELVDAAATASQTLLRLISDILDFSKAEAGEMRLQLGECGPHEIIEDAVALLWSAARRKKLSIASHVDGAVPRRVRADSFRIGQVLTNLIANAIKFTDQGGILCVLRAEAAGKERVRLTFEVHDTGSGIDLAEVETLFSPFRQGEQGSSRRHGGTGLGLAICRQLVGLMGGQIGADGTPGAGSSFWFTVPVDVLAPESALPEADLKGASVLVIDDDPLFRTLLQVQLPGAEVSVAETGEEGLRAAAAAAAAGTPFDAAVIDYHLPGLDGVAIGEALAPSGLALVMMTGAEDLALRRRAHAVGFQHFLQKPFRQAQVRSAIASAIAQRPGAAGANAGPVGAQAAPAPPEPAPPHPAPTPAPPTTSAAHAPPEPSGRPILVVEDNHMNQEVVRRQLAKLGVACDVASNGREALALLEERDYPLALVDCMMPQMDGLTLTREIRRREAGTGRRLPIVALTANALGTDAAACRDAGMDGYLAKPLTLGALAEVLRRWLAADAQTAPAEPDAVTARAKPEPGARSGLARPPSPPARLLDRPAPRALPGGANDHAPPAEPPIDAAALAGIFGTRDPAVLGEMLQMFAEAVADLMDELHACLEAEDAEGVREAAHAARGAGRNVAAARFVELLLGVEEAAGTADWPRVTALLPVLAAEQRRLADFVAAWPAAEA